MTTTNRFYAACLASYNAGILHGAWIEATTDVDTMQEAVAAMLRASPCPNVMAEHEGKEVPSAEEWAIHYHEGEAIQGISEYARLDTIAKLIEAVEIVETELGADGPAIVNAYWSNVGCRPDDPAEAVETAREHYIGQYDNATKWAEDFIENCGMLDELPEWARNYFDYEAYGRDAVYGGDIFESDGYWFNSR